MLRSWEDYGAVDDSPSAGSFTRCQSIGARPPLDTEHSMDRRSFLQAGLASGLMLANSKSARAAGRSSLEIAPFRFDVTPPSGHPLCGGWIRPVDGVDDALEAIGFVLRGAGEPIVVCAVDWTGLLNEAHLRWRSVLARAAGTTPDRVAIQCVHQHNAPFVCLDAERLVQQQDDLPHVVFTDFFEECLENAARTVETALKSARPVTHIAHGEAKVDRVASNRRFIGPDGKIVDWRGSASTNPRHKELPDGLIDPWLKTIAFYDNDTRIVACHYYATHPMSYYGDGKVSSDFVGLARKRRQQEEPECTRLYFTGCAGNIAAGKYNDGTPQARKELTDRIYAAIVASENELAPAAIASVGWTTRDVRPPVRSTFVTDELAAQIASKENSVANRIRPAMMLAWLRRCEQEIPITLSALHVNDVSLLHLPAESFLEYQLRAQEFGKGRFVATAAYGDGGPWYIPVKDAYPQGGYETTVAFCDPGVDAVLTDGIRGLFAR